MEVIDFTIETKEKEHSVQGIVSVVMAFVLVMFKFMMEIVHRLINNLYSSASITLSTLMFAWLLLGIILGVVGMMEDKNKKLFGILGFTLNMLHLFSKPITSYFSYL